jgi:hypothetical protein
MNTLNKQNYLTNLYKVLESNAVGSNRTLRTIDGNYLINPIDVNEVERMCIDLGLSYELIEMWGIRIWSL